MKIEISLFGALRECEPDARVHLDLDDAARVADLRVALKAHAQTHWSAPRASLLGKCALADERNILRDGDALPADGRVAVLPPVSGG